MQTSYAQNGSATTLAPVSETAISRSNVIIRPATLTDLPEIFAIYNHAILHTTATYQETPESQAYFLQWLRSHQKHRLPVLVAADRGVAGWASLSPYNTKSGYRYTVETSVYVREDRQGEGIGRALLTSLVQEAQGLGLHKLVSLVEPGNEPSIKLHASLGFVEAGMLHEVGFKFGRWLDVLLMEKTV